MDIDILRRNYMSTEKAITKAKAKQLDKKALKEILKFDGAEYVKVMISLYNELSKDLDKIDKERSELAKSIRDTVEARLKFIKESWEDLELTKEEKKKIYEDYMDTSKAFQQYLIDKEKQADKLKQKKEAMKVVSVGGIILTVCCGAVALAAKGVVAVIEARK